ncbi:MAG: hypothetical protein JJE40_07540 [Vicinamibacteria bacterium]|nr:hypothetical protein [Vicinamibacteria bacterium]
MARAKREQRHRDSQAGQPDAEGKGRHGKPGNPRSDVQHERIVEIQEAGQGLVDGVYRERTDEQEPRPHVPNGRGVAVSGQTDVTGVHRV